MYHAGGYLLITGPDAVEEYDTFTCVHCQRVVIVKPKGDAGGFCRLCMGLICGTCAASGECTPFEKKLDAEEKADKLMRQVKEGLAW